MTSEVPTILFSPVQDERLIVSVEGNWHIYAISSQTPKNDDDEIIRKIADARVVCFDASNLGLWDSSLLSCLYHMAELCRKHGTIVDFSMLPSGLKRLLELAFVVAPTGKNKVKPNNTSFLFRVGLFTVDCFKMLGSSLEFSGLVVIMFWQMLRGKRGFDWRDLFRFIEDCGIRALPIAGLISLLIGLILGFIGGLQLEQFGAQVYMANLVGIAMVREMGSMMIGIIMAGRTGAAFAAQLGTMQVNEEIDALETFGIDAPSFLIMPRVLAIVMTMPLLSIYANLLGILGGLVVGISLYDISITQYIQQTSISFAPKDFWIGLTKSFIYALIVSLSGCYRGFRCGRTAAAVGDATTSAVVTAIVLIIITDACAALICAAFGI